MLRPDQVNRPEVDDQGQQADIEYHLDAAIRLAEAAQAWPALLRPRGILSRTTLRWRADNIEAVARRYEEAGWLVIRPPRGIAAILGEGSGAILLLVDFRKS